METTANSFDSKMEGFKRIPPKTKTTSAKNKDVMREVENTPSIPEESNLSKFKFDLRDITELNYLERLERINVSPEEALIIIDELVRTDSYQETIKISKTAQFTIKTRDVRFTDYLTQRLDKMNVEKLGTFSQISSKYQLAAALVEYDGKKLPPLTNTLTDEEWENVFLVRLKFVSELSNPVFLALINHVARFDAKMGVVLSEGYEENF